MVNIGMPTAWTFPSNIIQYAEPGAENIDISWDDSKNFNEIKSFDKKSLQSNGSLIHIARSPKTDIKNKSYFLRCMGFNFLDLPLTISGIEVKVDARRYGRAQDETIQLCLNNNLIGNNLASPEINPEKVYGSSNDKWGTELSKEDIRNSTFGFTLRFQAHRNWPHKDPVLIDAVQMRIW
jgi:hypothetical protein